MNPSQIDKRQLALEELNKLSPEERLLALDKLAEKRKQKSFIKYFEPWSEQKTALLEFTSDKKVFALLGGNRSGKTILGSFIAVAWCLGKDYFKDEPAWQWVKDLPIPEPPNNVWVVGLDYATLRDVIWYEKLRHGKDHPPFLPNDSNAIKKAADGDFQIFFSNGSLLTGKSADAGREKFQGASIDLVWIDEECDKPVFDECYQRTVDCAGKLLLTLTPLTDINSGVREPWVFDLYEDWQAGDKSLAFCHLSTLNSPFISQEEKERQIRKWSGDPEEGARLYGKFVRRSGLVYNTWNRAIHVIPGSFNPAKHWPRIVTIDPAATGITAALLLTVNERGDYFGLREYYERDRTVSEHAKALRIWLAGEPVDYWLLDPYWAKQRNAESHKDGKQLYTDAGIPVRLPDVGGDGYAVSLSKEYVNAALDPTGRLPCFKITEGLPNFEHEINHYTWDTYAKGEQKGLSKDKPRKRHDHLLNAMQYALCLRLKAKQSRMDIFGNLELSREQRVKLTSYT